MFYVWQATVARGDCTVTSLQNFGEAFAIRDAVRCADRFPDDAFFAMNPENPKDINLPDQVYNHERLLVVGQPLRSLIEEIGGEIEFLPVAIRDHKGHVASRDYWIVNPLTTLDCLDVGASDLTVNAIDQSFSGCDALAFIDDRVPAGATLFRPSRFLTPIVCRENIAERVMARGFSGVRFVEADECCI